MDNVDASEHYTRDSDGMILYEAYNSNTFVRDTTY